MQTVTDLAKFAEAKKKGAGLKMLKAIRNDNWLRGRKKVTHNFYSTTIRESGFNTFRWAQAPMLYNYWAEINNANHANHNRPS